MIVKRKLYNKIEPYLDSKEAIIITGMRRTGKTTLLSFIYDKIDHKNKLFLDLENPLNQKYFNEENFEQIKFSLETLGIDFSKKAFVFLDEIQLIKNIPQIVKYFIDHYKVKFFLTGSASFYLKNLFSESLAGRKYVFELFPFDFHEFLQLKQINLKIPSKHSQINEAIFKTLFRYYDEFLKFGGFPQVIEKKSIKEKKQALNDIFTSYFQLEIKQLSDFRKTDKVRDLILLLAERTGNKLDIKKISQELNVSRATIYDYLSFLEATYFIKLARPFSKSRDVEIRKIPKVYFCDSGLVGNITSISKGSLFEQNVFQGLRLNGEVNYYQRKTGAEIDFILDKKKSFEVKTNPSRTDVNKLARISKAINIDFFRVVSLNYSLLKNVVYGFEI